MDQGVSGASGQAAVLTAHTGNERQAVAVFSRGIARIPHLAALLGQPVVVRPREPAGLTAVVGWGNKPTARRARAFAARHGLPYLALEDGFLRSMSLGVSGAPPLSIAVDDVGVYYDATRPSRLENLLQHDGGALAAVQADAARAMKLVVEHGLSKYNHAPDRLLPDADGRRRVLVVDQTFGDMSVLLGLASADTFARMLAAARAENPGAQIVIKTHPDVICGKKRGYLTALADGGSDILLGEDIHPAALLDQVDRVYTVTSLLGFEALLRGKPVSCFGMPFYAGWGVTDDRLRCPRRTARRSLLEVFAGAYLLYPRYRHPETGAPGDIFDVIAFLARQRAMASVFNGRVLAFGFQRWKRPLVSPFIGVPPERVRFLSDREPLGSVDAGEGDVVLRWGSRGPQALDRWAAQHGRTVWRMEDGFLRSVGLGSDLIPPLSLVIDRRGIYYDATTGSDLESMLESADFDDALLRRARLLRETIVNERLTKYNIDFDEPWASRAPAGRRVILVPGQVEDDASIRLGSTEIRTNHDLLAAVRRDNPTAWVVYRPHPDMQAGNRRAASALSDVCTLCDEVETKAALTGMLDRVDEVHTMTSLTGFDALLRGKHVVTYGLPFYAGWGLTEDRLSTPRRTRTLSIDMLVAGALIRYPRYWDPDVRGFVEVESTVRSLLKTRAGLAAAGPAAMRLRLRPGWLIRQCIKGARWLRLWLASWC